MWNEHADVDALMADFDEKFFGPAAGPMGRYITLMDAALRGGDYCTGSAWDMPHFYPPKLRGEARACLDEGRNLAAGKVRFTMQARGDDHADVLDLLVTGIYRDDGRAGAGGFRRGTT